jgi:hypothetical protein
MCLMNYCRDDNTQRTMKRRIYACVNGLVIDESEARSNDKRSDNPRRTFEWIVFLFFKHTDLVEVNKIRNQFVVVYRIITRTIEGELLRCIGGSKRYKEPKQLFAQNLAQRQANSNSVY